MRFRHPRALRDESHPAPAVTCSDGQTRVHDDGWIDVPADVAQTTAEALAANRDVSVADLLDGADDDETQRDDGADDTAGVDVRDPSKMTVDEVRDYVGECSPAQLSALDTLEAEGKGRKTALQHIHRAMDDHDE